MNIGFISLGCAKNLIDTEIMLNILKSEGHKIVDSIERADAVIINTCGFINDAKEEAIDTIIETGRLKNEGVIKYILTTGCLVQRYGNELMEELPEIDGALGISNFHDIASLLAEVEAGQRPLKVIPPPQEYIEKGPRMLTTPPGMAYLKISEGCGNHCAYCAIPSIRGSLRSKPLPDIEKEAHLLVKQGVKELVIIAQDTAAYGIDLCGKSQLPQVIKCLDNIEGISWLRVMYLHPVHFSQEIIDSLAKADKVIPYLDIPIQHASSRILKNMNRRYELKDLDQLIHKLRQSIENLVLRTTVMLGFPGETEQDFTTLAEFLTRTEFDWLGAFTFNPEEGTRAAVMEEQIPEELAQERKDKIMQLQNGITRKKNIKRVGKTENILISSQLDKQLYLGRGYFQAPDVDGLTIVKSSIRLKKGEFAPVELKAVRNYDMVGELVD